MLQFEPPWSAKAPKEPLYHNALIADAIMETYPYMLLNERMIRKGVVPLWNPYQMCGKPHSATAGVFYPISNLIWLVEGVARGWAVNALLHLWLAGLGMFLLMRVYGLRRAGAMFAALAYAFSGWAVSWLSIPSLYSASPWLPFIFLSFEICFRKEQSRHAFIGAAAFGMQILTQSLQVAFYSAAALALYTLFMAVAQARKPSKKSFVMIAVAPALILGGGILIGAVHIIPAYQMLQLSTRTPNMLASADTFFSSISRFVTLFMPDFFGNPARHNDWPGYNYSEMTVYCGIVTLFLAAIPIFRHRRPAIWFYTMLVPLSLLIAANTFVYKALLPVFPIIGVFSINRFSLIFCFSIAVLSGFGLDALIEEIKAGRKTFRITVLIFSVITAAAAILICINIRIHSELTGHNIFRTEWRELLKYALFAAAAFVPVATAHRLGAKLAASAVFALLFADLFAWGVGYNTVSKTSQVFPPSEIVEIIKRDSGGPFRVHAFPPGNILIPDTATAVGVEDIRGYSSLTFKPYSELLRAFQETRKPGSFVEGSWLGLTVFDKNLLQMLNVKYILTRKPVLKMDEYLEPVTFSENVYMYRFKYFTPRAFAVRSYVLPDARHSALYYMSHPNFDPLNMVVLGKKPEYIRSDRKAKGRLESLMVSRPEIDELRIVANMIRRSIIVVSEIDYPGWRMTVNGRPAVYQRADHVLRGIALDPGRFDIRFKFQPESINYGAAISIFVTVITLLSIFFINTRKNH